MKKKPKPQNKPQTSDTFSSFPQNLIPQLSQLNLKQVYKSKQLLYTKPQWVDYARIAYITSLKIPSRSLINNGHKNEFLQCSLPWLLCGGGALAGCYNSSGIDPVARLHPSGNRSEMFVFPWFFHLSKGRLAVDGRDSVPVAALSLFGVSPVRRWRPCWLVSGSWPTLSGLLLLSFRWLSVRVFGVVMTPTLQTWNKSTRYKISRQWKTSYKTRDWPLQPDKDKSFESKISLSHNMGIPYHSEKMIKDIGKLFRIDTEATTKSTTLPNLTPFFGATKSTTLPNLTPLFGETIGWNLLSDNTNTVSEQFGGVLHPSPLPNLILSDDITKSQSTKISTKINFTNTVYDSEQFGGIFHPSALPNLILSDDINPSLQGTSWLFNMLSSKKCENKHIKGCGWVDSFFTLWKIMLVML